MLVNTLSEVVAAAAAALVITGHLASSFIFNIYTSSFAVSN